MTDTPWQAQAHRHVAQARRQVFAALLTDAEARADPDDPDFVPQTRKLANKLAGCCRSPMLGSDEETGAIVTATDSCRSRVCPRCSKIRGGELRQAIHQASRDIDAPAFLTLTLASSDAPLRDQIDRLTQAARKLRQRRSWQKRVSGGIQVLEVTWSDSKGRWHPHLHCLVDAIYWPQSEIADEWQAVTGDSRIVDIRRVGSRSEAANYVAKYCSKGSDVSKIPQARIAEWCEALHGKRWAQTFGHLHGVKTKREDTEAGRSIAWHGYLAELWQARDQGDAAAARLLDQLAHAAANPDPDADRDLADELAEWYARAGLVPDPAERAPRDSGETVGQSGSGQSGLFADDRPPPATNAPQP